MNPQRRANLDGQPRHRLEGLLGGLTAVVWLVWSHDASAPGVGAAVLGAIWLAGAAVPLWLWPGDRHSTQQLALSSLASFALALLLGFACGPPGGVALILVLSALSFAGAGHAAVAQEHRYAYAPAPQMNAALAAKVALDEAMLGWFTLLVRTPVGEQARRAAREAEQAEAQWEAQGWLKAASGYHRSPPPAEDVQVRPARVARWHCEHVSLPSGYSPWPQEPGRERWLSQVRNRTSHAQMLRHRDRPRPWLICIHGYRMGSGFADLSMFSPQWLHRELGLNLLLPVLPLHGARRSGWLSGDGFLDGDPLDVLHAEAQAVWDLRRLLEWLWRVHDAPAVGVFGVSLGGYNAALLSALEPALSCVIAGIPATDLAALQWRHASRSPLRYMDSLGLTQARVQKLLTPVSPLAMPCLLERSRRFIFAASADRLVPPEQVVRLWQHWQQPQIHWYQGGHLTFRSDPGVKRLIETALRTTGIIER